MLLRAYERPWRPAYEAYAAVIWAGTAVTYLGFVVQSTIPAALPLALAAVCGLLAILRWREARAVLAIRASLTGHAMETIGTDQLRRLCRNPERVFLGFGFEWHPIHSQRL